MPFVRILVDWDGRKQAPYGRRRSTARHDVPVKHELQDFETLLMAVKAGHGLTQLTLWMVQDDVRGGLYRSSWMGCQAANCRSILWPRTKMLPAKMRVIVDGLARWAHESQSDPIAAASTSPEH
jgi:DNA-binding transcriptional LysR family regulator